MWNHILSFFFFFNDTATTEIYTLSLHDALPISGGPIDKSWLLLRALGLRSGLDLKAQTTVVYGAPPLLSQKALQGETDATLTFWNFCADLEAKGLKRAIPMDDVLR